MRVDLPDPDVLWARWGAFAATMTAAGYDDVYWCDAAGAHLDDHGGNWSRLVRVEGGRAVLFGHDHEYSDTTTASPPIDLLAGAPGWLPWDELLPHVDGYGLGYCYWWESAGWERVDYPGDPGDGLRQTIGACLDGDAARADLVEVVTVWREHDLAGDAEKAEVEAAAATVLAAAAANRIDTAALDGLLGRVGDVDLAAGLAMAATAGLTPGSTPPASPPAAGAPERRVRKLSDRQHDRLVWAAMREAAETPRPAPGAGPELATLVAWARGHAPGRDGRCTLLFEMLDTAARQVPGDAPPTGDDSWAVFDEATDLVRRLWEAEADPRHGHWIYLRLETTRDGYAIERRYDSWPDWMPDDGISGPWLDHLRLETGRRDPAFRPLWTALLDPDVVFTGHP